MTSEDERRLILEMIQNGKISADEGLRLLKALESDSQEVEEPELDEGDPEQPAGVQDLAQLSLASATAPDTTSETSGEATHESTQEYSGPSGIPTTPDMPDMARWRRMWMVPMWIGVGITVLSAGLMYLAQRSSGIGFLFFCSWVPFLLGLAVMVLALQSRTARWLHLRVQQAEDEWPRNIAISFPIPIHLTTWFLRNFRHKIRGLENTAVDEVMLALGNSTTPENPLYIEVDDDDDGEKVQIYIG